MAPDTQTSESQEQVQFDEEYLLRLRNGDTDTWRHFESHFRRMIHIRLSAQFRREIADELTGEVLDAVVVKIRQCALKDAARLGAYVAGVCRNVARSAIRGLQKHKVVEINWDAVPENGKSPEQEVIEKEKADAVHKVLRKLSNRDRNVLVDIFYHGLERDEVCRRYGATREQLRMILFHARQRFQREWGK